MKSSSLLTNDQPIARQPDHARQNVRSFSKADIVTVGAQPLRDEEATTKSIDLRAFRQLSGSYAEENSSFGARLELGVFALVIGLIAWPLASLLVVFSQTAHW